MASKAKGKGRSSTTVTDFAADQEAIGVTEPAVEGEVLDPEWQEIVKNPKFTFFDVLAALPDAMWGDQLCMYIYRIDPQIQNRTGEPAYIDKLTMAIDEHYLKTKHGGGKYHLMLKKMEGKNYYTIKETKIRIEGEPIYQPGQTIKGNPSSAPAPASTGSVSDDRLAAVVEKLILATGGNQKAVDSGLEVMKKAMTDGLDLQSQIIGKNLNSTTGSNIGDKLLERFLTQMNGETKRDPLVEELVKAAIEMMRKDRNPRPAEGAPSGTASVLGEFGLLKELFGVESIRDIGKLLADGKSTEQPWWAGTLGTLLEKAVEMFPTLMAQYNVLQQAGFERMVAAHAFARGVTPALPPLGAVPAMQIQPAATPPAPAGAVNMQVVMNQLPQIMATICRAYDQGFDGMEAAAAIKLYHPDAVMAMKPMLGSPQELAKVVQNVPDLFERSKDTDWAEFQDDFVKAMNEEALPTSPVPSEENKTAGANGSAEPSLTNLPGAKLQ